MKKPIIIFLVLFLSSFHETSYAITFKERREQAIFEMQAKKRDAEQLRTQAKASRDALRESYKEDPNFQKRKFIFLAFVILLWCTIVVYAFIPGKRRRKRWKQSI